MSDARESKVSAWVLAAAVFLASRWGKLEKLKDWDTKTEH